MKIEIRIESGRPAVFYTDDPDATDRRITCFTRSEEHSESTRAYMRGLKKPETIEEIRASFELLILWANRNLHAIRMQGKQ